MQIKDQLITMLLLNKKEKEELVIKLAKEGKTTREIAKIVHMSLKDIGIILRKITGDEDPKSESERLTVKLIRLCTSFSDVYAK